jgi:aminodeoxyfutalosine deaminase
MRKLSADYIFSIASEPIKNGLITIDNDGTILDVNYYSDKNDNEIEFYDGIICPGFINTHCHLELSHLRSQLSEGTGLTGFISEIMSKRSNFSEEEIQKSLEEAESEMIKNGIVAVGDISNNNNTFKQKSKQNLVYHTFIEVFSMDPDKANETFLKGLDLEKQLRKFELSNSIVPHAPYTMSLQLLKLINEHASENKSIISIHNQESQAESELFISGAGPMVEAFKRMGINTDLLRITGLNSLRSTLPYLNKAEKILLVHNTYTTSEDLKWTASKDSGLQTKDLFWCTCPNANLYIESKLPDYDLFISENAKLTIGTDSLASNWSLSILDEIKTISKFNPDISLQNLLTWATKNGADFLGLNRLGTIEKGKKPGLNLLQNITEMKISAATNVKKLV